MNDDINFGGIEPPEVMPEIVYADISGEMYQLIQDQFKQDAHVDVNPLYIDKKN
jgi:hypothetical protein